MFPDERDHQLLVNQVIDLKADVRTKLFEAVLIVIRLRSVRKTFSQYTQS